MEVVLRNLETIIQGIVSAYTVQFKNFMWYFFGGVEAFMKLQTGNYKWGREKKASGWT